MTNHDNQTTPQIYYRPLRKWLEVTLEEKQNWERFIGTTRKTKQRAGACCIPYKKSYKCDGLCEECEYRCILITALLFAWLCISIGFLVTEIQSFIYDRKREKRELAQAERDKEYHAKRMEELLNK